MATITYLGHSCFTLATETHSVVFDPFLTDNPRAACEPAEVRADAVLVSHGHGDHLGDAVAIARRLQCPVLGAYELCMYSARLGCEIAPMHVGGGRCFEFGTVKLTPALHGSAVVHRGGRSTVGEDFIEYLGLAVGFLVRMGGVTVYFAGDTGLFGDMALIGEAGLDVALLPIGDCFTMGPDDALRAVGLLHPRLVIPMHYNTFEPIQQDPEAFAVRVRERGVECRVLEPGEQTEVLPPS